MRILVASLSAVLALLVTHPLLGQTTIGTGSIVGAVTDPSGAVISKAQVTITNIATGEIVELLTNSAGEYNSGALLPGNYKI